MCLLLSLVEVQGYIYPNVTFMGETLPNHAYVDLSLVGDDDSGSDSVQCHTDLGTCCTGTQGVHRGDWYPPGSEERLPFFYERDNHDNSEARRTQRVDLRRRNNADMPSGIYRCDIATIAVYYNDTSVRESVYVGLYANGGKSIEIVQVFLKLLFLLFVT